MPRLPRARIAVISAVRRLVIAGRRRPAHRVAVVQRVAREVEEQEGAAAVLTDLGAYQDSKHLHVPVHSGARIR